MQRVHVQPQHQRACAHGTRTPAGGAPRGPGRPWRVAAAPELPMPWARAVLWARRRGSSMCPDRLILYAKCAFRIWCALTCAFRICPTENHAGIPLGCALTCALKNRAYGASVPAGGVCLQGQNDGTRSHSLAPRATVTADFRGWALARALLAARLLPLAGRAGQFHATTVDSQCFGGALPPFCASAAWQRSCCVCSPNPRGPAGRLG